MKVSDRVTGGILVGLGIAAAWGGSKLPPVPGQQVGPNVFPMVIGTALVLCGVLIILGVGRTFEEEEKIVTSATGDVADGDAIEPPRGRIETFLGGGWKVLVPPAALFFYYFASERLGFWITALLMIFALARSQGAKWKHAVALAICAPALVHLVFYKLLRVPLPPGLLKFPWA
ncbi:MULTISPECIES: tripartite tricarboxylate transporter TctB family protein [Ramlibacter]|uniref:Tripartite tricarboxylate transporter TctB family protein n=1 Tax=Ramlibacter pinisoli TaxID=2682844 RepID=A0A6N8IPA7_9BURK|nr:MULTISPECIES: tripartite tricarboxylate transporter TctB family protein [Ramlibacter]MBA2963418.1 tripartite tricarboxylate transporter TctB family protein [Ramlibacter sp. CGMCC 1.13660]MVQ28385.1 tripartite tricarboxylate transporter TctB family protein [Ramlibacter pinisoli]